MCNPATTKRIMDFDIDSVHPDIAAKARQVLSEHKLATLQPVSQAAATFYVWVGLKRFIGLTADT
jgi:CBS-domain-containing membrane protein